MAYTFEVSIETPTGKRGTWRATATRTSPDNVYLELKAIYSDGMSEAEANLATDIAMQEDAFTHLQAQYPELGLVVTK